MLFDSEVQGAEAIARRTEAVRVAFEAAIAAESGIVIEGTPEVEIIGGNEATLIGYLRATDDDTATRSSHIPTLRTVSFHK
jgi:hypothetical protein